MNKIDPPVEIENEQTKDSVEYILKVGSKEPAEYPEVNYFILI